MKRLYTYEKYTAIPKTSLFGVKTITVIPKFEPNRNVAYSLSQGYGGKSSDFRGVSSTDVNNVFVAYNFRTKTWEATYNIESAVGKVVKRRGESDAQCYYVKSATSTLLGGVFRGKKNAWKIAGPIALNKVVLEPGKYLQTLTAQGGTYPLNGLHTDGYWYIRRTNSSRA